MTREDIIDMAREAGWDMDDSVDGFSVRLERFAALVSAAELRRLHAEREVLLKALKYVYKELRRYGRQHWSEAVRASAAIKQVEGKA